MRGGGQRGEYRGLVGVTVDGSGGVVLVPLLWRLFVVGAETGARARVAVAGMVLWVMGAKS